MRILICIYATVEINAFRKKTKSVVSNSGDDKQKSIFVVKGDIAKFQVGNYLNNFLESLTFRILQKI